jgi:hypothetical protein
MRVFVTFYQIVLRLNRNAVERSSCVSAPDTNTAAADRLTAMHHCSTSHCHHAAVTIHTTGPVPCPFVLPNTLLYSFQHSSFSCSQTTTDTTVACLGIYRVFLTNGVRDNETHLVSSTLFLRVREQSTEGDILA